MLKALNSIIYGDRKTITTGLICKLYLNKDKSKSIDIQLYENTTCKDLLNNFKNIIETQEFKFVLKDITNQYNEFILKYNFFIFNYLMNEKYELFYLPFYKKKAYTILEKDFFITKSDLSAKIKKYEQLERERNNLTKANGLLNNTLKMNNMPLPFINGEEDFSSGDNKNLNTTLYVMNKGNVSLTESNVPYGKMNRTMNGFGLGRSVDKKSWKDTKLYKGNSLSYFKKNVDMAYKMKEIKKILDNKNNIIRRQNNEISNLKNILLIKESELFGK